MNPDFAQPQMERRSQMRAAADDLHDKLDGLEKTLEVRLADYRSIPPLPKIPKTAVNASGQPTECEFGQMCGRIRAAAQRVQSFTAALEASDL